MDAMVGGSRLSMPVSSSSLWYADDGRLNLQKTRDKLGLKVMVLSGLVWRWRQHSERG